MNREIFFVVICLLLLATISIQSVADEQGESLLLVKKKGGARYRYNKENILSSEAKLGVVWGRVVREHYKYYFLADDGSLTQMNEQVNDETTDTIVKLNKTLLDFSNLLPSINRGDERLINGRIYRFLRDELHFTGVIRTLKLDDETTVVPGSIKLVDFNNFGDREGVPYSENSDAGGLLIIRNWNIEQINSITPNRFNIFAPGYSYTYIYDEKGAENYRGKPLIRQIIRRDSSSETGEGTTIDYRNMALLFAKGDLTADDKSRERLGKMFEGESGELRRVTITGFSSDLLKESALKRAYALKSYLANEKRIDRDLIKVKAINSPLYALIPFGSGRKLPITDFKKLFTRLEQRYGRAGVTVVEYSRASSSDKARYKLYKRLSRSVDSERSGFFRQKPAAGEEERVEIYLTHRVDRKPLLFEGRKLTAEGTEELKRMGVRLGRYLRDYPDSRLIVAGGEESGISAEQALERRQRVIKALLHNQQFSRKSIVSLSSSARRYKALFKGGLEKGAVSVWLLRDDKKRDRVEIEAEFLSKQDEGAKESEAVYNLTYDDKGRVEKIRREFPGKEGYFNEWYFIYRENTLFYLNRWNYGKERFEVFCHKFNEQGYPTHYYRFRGRDLDTLKELNFVRSKNLQAELNRETALLEEAIPRFLPPLYRYKRANPDSRYRENLERSQLMVLDDELLSAYYLNIINWYREGRE